MGAVFVRTTDTYTASTVKFSHGNQGGNALIYAIATYSVSTQPAFSSSFVDSAGNTFIKVMDGTVAVYTGGVNYAVYLCKQCVPSSSNTITQPGGSSAASIMCNEYGNATILTDVDGVGAASTSPSGGTLVVPGTTGGLIVAIGNVVSGTYAFSPPFNTRVSYSNTFTGEPNVGGDQIASGSNTNVVWGSSPGFGSMLAAIAFKGFSSGPPAPGSSNLQLIGGPKYTFSCLPEGRKFARVSLNLAAIPVIPGTFYFDELSDNIANPVGIAGYIAVEFDLAQFVRGVGLSQVRTLIAYSRPLFSGDDFGATVGSALPALLTCKQTGQSITLGAGAIALGTKAAVEHLVTSFVFSCDNSAKVRFLAPMTTLTGFGRYNLLFCNWDQPQGIDIAGSF